MGEDLFTLNLSMKCFRQYWFGYLRIQNERKNRISTEYTNIHANKFFSIFEFDIQTNFIQTLKNDSLNEWKKNNENCSFYKSYQEWHFRIKCTKKKTLGINTNPIVLTQLERCQSYCYLIFVTMIVTSFIFDNA